MEVNNSQYWFCPECRSDNICEEFQSADYEVGILGAYFDCYCEDCGAEWTRAFTYDDYPDMEPPV